MTHKKNKPRAFYHQYIQIEKIHFHIKNLNFGQEEEKQTWEIVEEIIHTRFLDAVLDKLPAHKHETFLEKFSQNPEDKELVKFLETETQGIHSHLHKTWEALEKEILQDILES